jgi:hypothetical protein
MSAETLNRIMIAESSLAAALSVAGHSVTDDSD